MMKSFFKKLAFVMALAMVVSMAAPAGSALAAGLTVAYQNGGAVSELNVKAGAEQDLKFLGAPKNWKELAWGWTSSNDAVATVDQSGIVTAVANGTATITITVGDLTGSVVVNVGEVKAYDVTLGTADKKDMTTLDLAKDGKLDLNFYGVKDWNKNNYTVAWSVSGDAVKVDNAGLVTAVKAGKAVVTASIINNVTGVAHNVTPVEVTVAADVNPDAFTVAQKDTDKFVITFAEAKAADAVKEGLTVSVKINDQEFPISFENVVVDGNKVTVTTYAQFENDEVYTLTFGKETVEHTIVLGGVAKAGITYYTGKNKDNKVAYVTEEEHDDYVTLVPVLFDEYGNNITDKYNLKNFDFNYEVSSNVKPAQIYNDTFAFDAAGLATVTVTAAFVDENGEYVEVQGSSVINVVKRGAIALKLERAGIAPVGWLKADAAYTYIADPATSFRLDANSAVWNAWGGSCVGTTWEYRSVEAYRNLTYTAVFADNRGNVITSNAPYDFGSFTYESTNNEVLTVDDLTGYVELYKPGKANILVYFTPADGNGSKKLVASTPITVTPELYPASYKVLNATATTASHVVDDALNDVAFKVQFYDQYGNVFDCKDRCGTAILDAFKVEARDTNNTVTPKSISWDSNNTLYKITFDGSDFVPQLGTNLQKSFSYKFSLEDTDVTETIKTAYSVFTATVKDTATEAAILSAFINNGTAVPADYKFNIALGGSTSVDVAVKNIKGYEATWASALTKSKNITATYLSTGNLALANVPAAQLVDNTTTKATTGHMGYVYYKVSAPTKTTVAGNTVNNDAWGVADVAGKVTLSFNEVTGSTFKYAANGSYTVSFATTRTEGGNLYNVKTSSVNVSNSQLQVKYLGLNPETEGLTELAITTNTADLDLIAKEQLLFAFDEVVLGNYYEGGNKWGAHTLTYVAWDDATQANVTYTKTVNTEIDWANSKYVVGSDSVTFSTLAIVVTIDNGPNTTAYTYTSMVPVGARIKVK